MWPFSSSQDEQEPSLPSGSLASTPRLLELEQTLSSSSPPSSGLSTDITPTAFSELTDHPALHFTNQPNERLGLPTLVRAPLVATSSFITGFGLGVTTGGRKRADRFRAENSHRFPTTQAGWYLYHRSKSYNTVVGGVTEGIKFGGQLAVWTTMFMGVEEVMDRTRARLFARDEEERGEMGQRDAANTVVAGMTTVGVFCLVKRMDVFAAGKLARMAFKYSLAYGLAQDGLAWARGEQPGYLRWMMGKVSRNREERGVV